MNDPYMKAMFGIHAVHVPVQLLMQAMGSENGRHLTLAAALISTPERLVTPGYTHELIVGDMVVRPFGRWASEKRWLGYGMTGLMTSEAVFPEGHEVQTLENGWENIRKRIGSTTKVG
jgi:hypothetical protein